MKKLIHLFVLLSLTLTACGSLAPVATPIPPVASATPAAPTGSPVPAVSQVPTTGATSTSTLVPTPVNQAVGPTNFPAGVNPLTGLQVPDPSLLERRPLLVKVSNLPRTVRPQWGLSLADIVFEYYTEEGSTRFAALFYGNNASRVGPIRSARFIDLHLVRGYKAVFAFVSAYDKVIERLFNSEFADRLVTEGDSTPITRYNPDGSNDAVVNTADLSAYITSIGVENGRQNLDGMSFNSIPPAGGVPAAQVLVRYSGAIYNRWDYDPASGKYLRFADTANDVDSKNPQYAQSTDRLTGQPLAFDNVVVVLVNYEYYDVQVWDPQFLGTGQAYAFRDGQAWPLTWQRNPNDVVSLVNPDGTPYPFKPGTTWFEVMGMSSQAQQTGQGYSFQHFMP